MPQVRGGAAGIGAHPFFPWIGSKANPVDAPSSVHGVRAERPQPAAPVRTVRPTGAGGEGRLVLLLCSGEARAGDIAEWISHLGAESGLLLTAVRVDPRADPAHDLLDPRFVTRLEGWIRDRRAVAVFGSPPCSTWSRARFRPIAFGPRPLRDRESPYECLANRTPAEVQACDLGTALLLRTMLLLQLAVERGLWVGLEHPQDWGPPYPSIWSSPWVQAWVREGGITVNSFDQCMWGAMARKPTSIASQDPAASAVLCRRCNHARAHRPAVGRGAAGFRTTPLAAYPSPLCKALAGLMVDAALRTAACGAGAPFVEREAGPATRFSHRVAARFATGKYTAQI